MTKEMAIQLLQTEGVWLTAKGKELLEQLAKGDKEVTSLVVSSNDKM